MAKFAVLADPVLLKSSPYSLKVLHLLKRLRTPKQQPVELTQIPPVKSKQGNLISGSLFILPAKVPKSISLLTEAAVIAKRCGIRTMGIAGFPYFIDAGCARTIYERTGVSLTQGALLSAWSLFESLFRIAKSRNIELQKCHFIISGADNPIGRLLAKKLSSYSSQLTFLDSGSNRELTCADDNARKNAEYQNIIINCGFEPVHENYPFLIEPGTVVLDPKATLTEDILQNQVIKCGFLRLPPGIDNYNSLFSSGIVDPCIAEVMILAAEEIFGNYAIDECDSIQKMESIADIAAGQGYQVWLPQAPAL